MEKSNKITSSSTVHGSDTEHIGFRIFRAIGTFSVKFRWLVVIVWLVGTIAAVHSFPSLSSVTQSDNTSFLPASAPSEKAIKLQSAFGKLSGNPAIQVVVATNNGKALSATDLQYAQNLQTKMGQVSDIEGVQLVGQSSDGQAEEINVITSNSANTNATPFVNSLRSTINKTTIPNNLQVHLAGQIADGVDASEKSGSTDSQVRLAAVIFILILLLLIFRAPLSPIITLVPPLFVVVLAGPVIAEIGKHGLKVSSLAQLLLTVLVLGAGTDYGLFLIFRVREELKRGLSSREAIIQAMSRVGESITFSAATVIAALLSLLVATFELYSTLGAPLAIGIGLMLLAGLTLLPALLAIFGSAAFWPFKPKKETTKSGIWGRVSSSVVQRPIPVLIAGVVLFSGLALFVTQYKAAGFGGTSAAPSGSDSAQGDALISKHFPSNSSNPTGILFVLPQSVWQNPAPLATMQSELSTASEFTHVSGPLNPNGVLLTPQIISAMYKQFGAPVHLSSKTDIAKLMAAHPELASSVALQHEFEAYQILGNYVSNNGRTVEYAVGLTAGNPALTEAINATPAIRARVQQIANSVHATNSGIAGESTALYDISNISNSDLLHVIPVAIIIIGVLLAILLRSLVAPLYLVLSVGLSYLTSLGISVLIFMKIGHESGLTFILPFLMFIFLLALGEDYNILVMTRIREEANGLNLRAAVSKALTTTGTTVTSAGVVLAGTFGVLAVVGGNGNPEIRDIGAGLAIGILLDTFLVRTLLVPSIVVLLGRWNWWPSKHGSWATEDKE